ncbi:MAG: TRAP-type C4-dicarboxylate transport system permease small subunit [Oleiphilaceae bacterium]|jgi:TRAP-type C4-dicarboxylate transport system permease small subunit
MDLIRASAEEALTGSVIRNNSMKFFKQTRRVIEWTDIASYWTIVITMGLMVMIVSLQVLWRYVLGSSIDSADELARLFFVWTIFLAIPHGIKSGAHIGIDLLVVRLPDNYREILFRVITAVSCLLMLTVMFGAWTAMLDRWPELMPTLPITSAIYYIALLICGTHSFMHLVFLSWGGSKAWENGQ